MNIFYLDRDPAKAASYLTDKHVVKMIVESCQMLATAHHMCGSTATYKATHINHPSNVWVREHESHYEWLWNHAIRIGLEYTRRYGKSHKCMTYLRGELFNPPPNVTKSSLFFDPPQCMPNEYKHPDTVTAYRNYYLEVKIKQKGLVWKQGAPDIFKTTIKI